MPEYTGTVNKFQIQPRSLPIFVTPLAEARPGKKVASLAGARASVNPYQYLYNNVC